jgi:aspartate kinase
MFTPRDENFSSECPSPRRRTRSVSPAVPSLLANLTLTQADKTVPEFHATVDLIREEHVNEAKRSVRDPGILKELEAEIERDCEWLRGFLFAAQVSDKFEHSFQPW